MPDWISRLRASGAPASALLAVVAGVAAALSFAPFAWVVLLVPAVAALSLLVHRSRPRVAALVGLLFGLGFMATLLPWLSVIGRDAWIGLSLLEAAFYALLGFTLNRVQRLPFWPVLAAASWVGAEVLRSLIPWGGFPWGRLAFATIDTPAADAMAWVGTAGTSFLVALLGTTGAWLVLRAQREGLGSLRARTPVLAVAGALAMVAAPALLPLPGLDASGTVQVAAVQGDVPGAGMDAFAERRAVLDNHVGATLTLAERIAAGEQPQPDFVLWPENSTDIDPFTDPTVYADIQRAVDAVGVPVLVGAMVTGPGPIDVRNQGIVWSPGSGPGDSYSKRHPVPFGEYIPMRKELASLFERLDQIPRDMVPGTTIGVLDLAGTPIGDLICFEVAYDGLVRDVVDGGAELLVVQTNNATYMGTGQVEQQFAIARLRAIEAGRTVVVVATNGVSGIVMPDGSVAQRLPTREPGVMNESLTLREGTTPGVRLGAPLEVLLSLVALGGLLLAGGTSRARWRPARDARPAGGPDDAAPAADQPEAAQGSAR